MHSDKQHWGPVCECVCWCVSSWTGCSGLPAGPCVHLSEGGGSSARRAAKGSQSALRPRWGTQSLRARLTHSMAAQRRLSHGAAEKEWRTTPVLELVVLDKNKILIVFFFSWKTIFNRYFFCKSRKITIINILNILINILFLFLKNKRKQRSFLGMKYNWKSSCKSFLGSVKWQNFQSSWPNKDEALGVNEVV